MRNLTLLTMPLLSLTTITTLAAERPNVIFIITDQQSANTISALKEHTRENYFETPNMDRLVNGGYTYLNSCCPNPGSMPSRFAIFTGLFGGEYMIRSNWGKHLEADIVMPVIEQNAIGTIFKNAGYETLYGGKVHLPFSEGRTVNMHSHPVNYGFDVDLGRDERGLTAQNAAAFIKERKPSDKPFFMVTSFINPHDICMEGSVHKAKDTYPKVNSEKISERVNMVKQVRDEYESINRSELPDLPYNFEPTEGYPKTTKKVSENFTDDYWRQYRWIYKRLVSVVDAHVGTILDALDANAELKENTIVVFTSDHGEMQGAHRAITKGFPYYESQMVPLIFSGASIPKGEINTKVMSSGVDIYPTLCEMVGITPPSKLDGVSLAKVTSGKSKSIDREAVYNENFNFVALIKGDYKYTYFDLDDTELLVNTKSDPGEMLNLLSKNSSKYRAIADELRSELMKIYTPRREAMFVEQANRAAERESRE